MPVTPIKAWPDSRGTLHPTIGTWRVAEMYHLLATMNGSGQIQGEGVNTEKILTDMADDLVQHGDAILAILTTGPRSRPSRRKAGGTTNPRRALTGTRDERAAALRARSVRATPAQAEVGFTG